MTKLLVLLASVAAVRGFANSANQLFQNTEQHVPDVRVVGGHDADIADYPYQLSVYWFGIPACGASLIAPKWVLTAAQCTYTTPPENLTVRAGSSTLDGGQTIRVATIYKNPRYDKFTMDYDIAVLELEEEFTIENASPIALHESGYVAEEGAEATVIGWGATCEICGDGSGVLQALVTKIVGTEACNETYKGQLTNNMLCAGNWDQGGEDTCQGFGGVPLVVDGKQYGVDSWGIGCARPHYPGIYNRISDEYNREFIRNITGL